MPSVCPLSSAARRCSPLLSVSCVLRVRLSVCASACRPLQLLVLPTKPLRLLLLYLILLALYLFERLQRLVSYHASCATDKHSPPCLPRTPPLLYDESTMLTISSDFWDEEEDEWYSDRWTRSVFFLLLLTVSCSDISQRSPPCPPTTSCTTTPTTHPRPSPQRAHFPDPRDERLHLWPAPQPLTGPRTGS